MSVIDRIMAEAGFPGRSPRDIYGDESVDRQTREGIVCSLYGAGLSMQETAVLVGLSKERVRQILAKHGIEPRPAAGSRRWRLERALAFGLAQ